MKSKTLLSIAVAGAFACSTGAYAGSNWNGYDVRTPSSVNESAPWLANEPHMPASSSTMTLASTGGERSGIDTPIASGASSSMSGTGSGSYSSDNTAYVEYWLLGSEGADVALDSAQGLTTSPAGYGSVGLDSSMSGGELMSYSFEPAASAFEMVLFTPSAVEVIEDIGDRTPLLSEHYLIPTPESAYDPSQVVVLMIGPGSEDIALLDSFKEHFFVLTPVYGEA